jgi:hypothetical protein
MTASSNRRRARVLGGQQALFDERPKPAQPLTSPPPRRKGQRHPTWQGTGRCRSCDHRYSLYRDANGYTAWSHDHHTLTTTCPQCGIALTTTTIDLTDRDPDERRGFPGSPNGLRTMNTRLDVSESCQCGCGGPATHGAFGDGVELFTGCERLVKGWYHSPTSIAEAEAS